MSYELVRLSVSDYVKANFPTTWPLTVEGFPFDPPVNQVWVRFGIHPNVQVSEEIEGKTERMEGNIWFQIFLPENTGTAAAYQIADVIKLMMFEHHIVVTGRPVVMCRAAPLEYIGNDGSGWENWAVNVPYLAFAQVP